MKTFATSDLHFGHANIIRYCDRPFKDVVAMDQALIERWNSRVGVDDTVYFLGDFAFASQDRILDILELLHFKHLYVVPGNHDKNLKKVLRYETTGNMIFPEITLLDQIHEIEIDNQHFVLCHFPIQEWHRKERGSIHLHGHTHTQFGADSGASMALNKKYDIGTEMYGGPVEITADCRFLNNPQGWSV